MWLGKRGDEKNGPKNSEYLVLGETVSRDKICKNIIEASM
jgi:hypothetical protein